MRNWPDFKKNEPAVTANSAREVYRDFPIFARMAEGAKYPEAYEIAEGISKRNFGNMNLFTGHYQISISLLD